MRHWKQRYSFDADLIFSRTMKLGICGVAVVKRGDDVTDEMKAILGRNRLKLWWESKRVELARFDGDLGRQLPRDPDEEARLAEEAQLAEDESLRLEAEAERRKLFGMDEGQNLVTEDPGRNSIVLGGGDGPMTSTSSDAEVIENDGMVAFDDTTDLDGDD